METKQNIEDLYFVLLHDAYSWVQKAERHLIPANIIHKELVNHLHGKHEIPDELTDMVMGLIDSYMLLLSLSFENIIKGLIVSIKPDFIDTDELKIYKWGTHGGHGIVEMLKCNFKSLDSIDSDLIERLQTYLIWAGKYQIPKSPDKYVSSRIPKIQKMYRENDNITAERLFNKIKRQIELNWERNLSVYYRWNDEYYDNKYNKK